MMAIKSKKKMAVSSSAGKIKHFSQFRPGDLYDAADDQFEFLHVCYLSK